jgi:hypothetical protein
MLLESFDIGASAKFGRAPAFSDEKPKKTI